MDDYTARMLYLFGVVLALLAVVALVVIAVYRIKSRRELAHEDAMQAEIERQQQGPARQIIEAELETLGPAE